MDTLIYYVCVPLGVLMKWCWQLVGNYGAAILLFTLATKIVLLPISIWIQKNSIKMVQIQPEINFLKVRLFGNSDAIAEEQAKLFKREHYHPLLSLIPLGLQVFLLLGVVEIIYHPLGYLFGVDASVSEALANFIGADTAASSYQLSVIEAIKDGTVTASSVIPGVGADTLSALIPRVLDFDLSFLGLNLSAVPTEVFGVYLLVPVIAGLSSFFLCLTQNLANVIQHEQSKWNQYGLMIFSVGLSLYLGCFVPAGIGLYWVASNAFSILQMYALNAAINPKKYVNYAELEKSRRALAELNALDDGEKKNARRRELRAREKADYKRFTKVANKHLVIYSERSGFYKYFKDLIAELPRRSNLTIHYVTNDPDDKIFELAKTEPRIRPYYVGLKKTVTLFMMLETEIMVMTTPDLDKFYFKRSYMKKDIEYIYVPHDMMSSHLTFREGAFDAFDTIFCAGEHIKNEMLATEKVYGTKRKNLIPFGYPLSDALVADGEKFRAQEKPAGAPVEILIAPSWQEDNLLDSCVDQLIDSLYGAPYHITVRPHPEYVKRYRPKLDALVNRYADKVGDLLTFELDFSGNKSIYSSDLLITDWSGVGVEFCIATRRPALFINTKVKCENPNWEKIGIQPVDFTLRNEVGIALEKSDLSKTRETVEYLLANPDKYEAAISAWFDKLLYNHGTAAAEGAKYILHSLADRKGKK